MYTYYSGSATEMLRLGARKANTSKDRNGGDGCV